MDIKSYLETNLRNFDKDYLKRTYQSTLQAEDGISLEESILKILVDNDTIKLNNKGELYAIQKESALTNDEYFRSDEEQGVLTYYYLYNSNKKEFSVKSIDIFIENDNVVYYKYGFTIDGNASFLIKANDKFILCSTTEGANIVNKDISSNLSISQNSIILDDKKVETQIIDNSNVSNTEVFPIEDNDWN